MLLFCTLLAATAWIFNAVPVCSASYACATLVIDYIGVTSEFTAGALFMKIFWHDTQYLHNGGHFIIFFECCLDLWIMRKVD